MDIKVNKVTRKLTGTLLNQITEATMADMKYAVEKGKVLGYINTTNKERRRVFLILNEKDDYRIVTNFDWRLSQSEPTNIYRSNSKGFTVKKLFSTEHAKIEFLELFSAIKKVALETHIYI